MRKQKFYLWVGMFVSLFFSFFLIIKWIEEVMTENRLGYEIIYFFALPTAALSFYFTSKKLFE